MKKYSFVKWALALLGFSAASCSEIGGGLFGGGEVTVMYGVPHADFTIKGSVADTEMNPLNGIEVTHNGAVLGETNSQGAFNVEFSEFSMEKVDTVVLNFHDVDGKENGGKFIDAAATVKMTAKDFDDKSGWKTGEYTASGVRVTMTKEE